ncbi:MAG: thioredoxin domain-containing protein [Proteobacteria bacterium]|nr:thioredoxin domain-containing protein [Pseudomonadota bacterium]
MTGTSTPTTNRLAQATSPYLLQHQQNPVDWWQWGPEALAEAQRSNRPILLSIGYAACHWCHVMAHESFEDEATAAVMNALFVNIKVDREERPDIDQIYMNALHLLGEQGGWPLTMFLTPAGEPVWGGTYFPKESKFGRPAFTDILREVSRLFREEPAKIEQNRAALLARLNEVARPEGKVTIGLKELDAAAKQLGNAFDTANGGLRGAPKFPQAALYEMLWRAGERAGDARFFDLVDFTLAHIAEGGIYDHLGGGFARYSVDEYWLVPHFEKMLYDNAQLLDLFAAAWTRSKNPLFRARASETVGWLQREMTNLNKAFCSSLDADSEGEEGKFYVWSLAEIREILGSDSDYFAAQYDVTDEGNFEGHNILNRLKRLPRNIGAEGSPPADEARLAMLRGKLLKNREKRIRPSLDDKVLADWNGLMIAGLVHASTAFEQPAWLIIAQQAFDFVANTMTHGDRLGHSWRDGKLLVPGLASDFACMIKAALALNEATGDAAYLHQALVWQAAFDRHYANPANGGYFLTADDAEGLVIRPAGTNDDATPNPNSIAAANLVRLAVLTGDDRWRAQADGLLEGVLATATQNLFGHVALLNALELRLRGAEIVCVGHEAEAFAQEALKLPHLSRIVLRAPSAEALPPSHPARDKVRAMTGSAAFICVGERCSLPVTEPGQIAEAVQAMQGHTAAK